MKFHNILLKVLQSVLLAVSAYYIVAFLVIALLRLNYPFELEWMEGGMLESVRWILNGHHLYVKPTMEFIPFIYTPLYYWLAAGLSKIMGTEFITLRLISFVSAIACFVMIGVIVKRATKSYVAAIFSAGLFAATYKLSGLWFDIARVDSLFMSLLLAVVVLLQQKDDMRYLLIASLFSILAFLTKQNAIIFVGFIAVYLMVKNYKKNWIYALVSLGGIAAVSWLLNMKSGGWFSYYVFELPRQHQLLKSEITQFWKKDIIAPLWILISVSVSSAVILIKQKKINWLFTLAIAAWFVIAWTSRIHSGGYKNVLMPAYAGLALIGGLTIGHGKKIIGLLDMDRREWLDAGLKIVLIVQLGMLFYPLRQCIPDQTKRQHWEKVVEKITEIKGAVFIPYHGYLATKVGKKSYAHSMAVKDILRGKASMTKLSLVKDIDNLLSKKNIRAIIYDPDHDMYLSNFYHQLDKNFNDAHPIVTDDQSRSWLVTGMQTKPDSIREVK